ncbi:plasmid replication initiator protein [Streptomyces sp. NBC_01356]|uniref:replication initiator n=1 Tax=Streptomyces sp. NBC_01356 TaxID=2903836 RepID=UPI002E32A49A|nr:replication initiator [Streptomyces sp. NBC_01356]
MQSTTVDARRSVLHRAERLRRLSDTERDLIRLANEPGFPRWLEQIKATGGCAHPIYLSGRTTVVHAETGQLLRHYDTDGEPGGRLPVRCRNRRESRCPPCSRLHCGDTFHLVRAGLLGGKGIPATVADHPRLFVTLTAPSFGAVHRATSDGEPCRPRAAGTRCEHGRPVTCGLAHAADESAVGQPLCPDCYDYAGHVLWHAHAGELWNRTTRAIRRHLATAAGITQSWVGEHLRLSFAKVAEYQRRGAVHFHAIIRLDGPEGPETPPPVWATAEVLDGAVHAAVRSVEVSMPYVPALGERAFRWGTQLDVHPIRRALDDGPITDQAVAAYVAKYVSKSVGDVGGTDRPVASYEEIDLLPVLPHTRALIGTCWRLGRLGELDGLSLRAWAHALGYRGHVLTKSRRYSTTYAALRLQRVAHRQPAMEHGPPEASDLATECSWRYVGSGHTPAEALVALGVVEDFTVLAEMRREFAAIPDLQHA